jgi:hypothetical protein
MKVACEKCQKVMNTWEDKKELQPYSINLSYDSEPENHKQHYPRHIVGYLCYECSQKIANIILNKE